MVKSGLPPCHTLFQFYVADGKLSCQLYQRSADVFLGVPFNIASYALLTFMIAKVTGFDQVNEQLSRDSYPLPNLIINDEVATLFDFLYEDFELRNYQHHPAIPASVAV